MANRLRGHSFRATPTRHQPPVPPRTSADSRACGPRAALTAHSRESEPQAVGTAEQRLASSYARRPPPHRRPDPLPPDPPEGGTDLAGADLSLPDPGEDGADLARGTSPGPDST
ncbi:hypothetical protein OsJ_24121 [Oryza sativa Japonica Group]|uniref:Uncharacterized protein n=1 Tax=Oryza sativa subsp. japonica TaxID=39947 RepID=B9FX23_ORYSJ|nr:hypothetical protein OsJ_24121 [Oryza sativa Japonica Group]